MERIRKGSSPDGVLGRRVPALLVWIFLAGCTIGVIVGLFLPEILPGFLPRGRIPSFLWGHDGTLSVHPGKDAGTLPATLLPVLSSTTVAPAAAPTTPAADILPTWDVARELGTLPMDSMENFVASMKKTTGEESEYLEKRWDLAQTFIKTHELQGNAIEAFLRTPRQDFVRARNVPRAYEDIWMPVGYGATITNPAVVGMMTTTLDVKPGQKVLEIGTGSGYQSAILSHLTNNVYSIEIIEPLFHETDALYKSLQSRYPMYANIHRKLGDGYYGWEKYAPFDRIIVTCAVDHLPPPLIQQLAPRGIMVVPLGPPARQYIMKVERSKDDKGNTILKRTDVYNGLSVKFIPFLDEQGKSYSGQSQ